MTTAIRLTPLRDVQERGAGFVALSDEPWLRLDAPALRPGRFVEITYRASFWDEPLRPVFRFECADGRTLDRIAAGPVAGAGSWIGRVPAGTTRVSVSPTSRPGVFGFAVELVRRRFWFGLLAQGLRSNPRATRSAILTRLIGWRPESDVNLAWAIGATPLVAYRRWRRSRRRPLDLDGIDAPRFDWSAAPPIHLMIDARGGMGGLDATLRSLEAQVFGRWTAEVVSAERLDLPADPRIRGGTAIGPIADGDGLLGTLRPGDRLLPHALACLAETAHRHPGAQLFYGDEEIRTPAGAVPVLKPGWSPLLQRQRPFLGRAVFLRAPISWSPETITAFMADAMIPPAVADSLDGDVVVPLRRILLQTEGAANPPIAATPPNIRSDASAAIIVPTRDQPERLSRAVASIRAFPGSGVPQIVIVDNGSVAPETLRLLQVLRESDDVTVLPQPGPFNFSAMCNAGAAASDAEVLIFLNDDTEALSPDWLDRLRFWATRPDIGAVGAKLTYPDGRLQHVGVLLGMGGSAGHFGALAPPDASGWAGRNRAAHEVSAVTGACLAVARHKFEAVGGFDARHLPIELSDIDLCLELAARGWTAMVDPDIRLRHDEFASRGGATFRRLDVYASQRIFFETKWKRRLRDDPFFHPGLSLYSWTAALA